MRVNPVFRPADFVPSEGASREDSAAMFSTMFPGVADPGFDAAHAGFAIVAVNPGLALQLRAISMFMLATMPFGRRTLLRELAIQTAHRKLNCAYGFNARVAGGLAAGLTEAMLAALPDPRPEIFDEEQRLVIAYAAAVVDNAVDDELLARFTAHFDEKAAIECAALVGMFACWSMIINVGAP